jgi:DNA-binding response OmpR family regulator
LLFNRVSVHYIESIIIMKQILLINNRRIPTVIPRILTEAGFVVENVSDNGNGTQFPNADNFDLIIVVENADAESWRLCQNLRRQTAKPLIVISTNASTETCVQAIYAGADFFLRKPFGALELVARVNTLLQRSPRKVISAVS